MQRALIITAAVLGALAVPAGATAAAPLVEVARTGGFIGGVTTTTVDTTGRGVQKETRFGTRTTFTVPAGPLADLRARLRAAGFDSLGQYPPPPGSADLRLVHITYAAKTVDASWQAPKRLTAAVDGAEIAGARGADVLHYVDGTDADNPIYLTIHAYNRDRYSAPALKSVRRALARRPLDTRLTDPDAPTKGVRLTMGYVTVRAGSLDRLPIGASARAALAAILNRS